MCGIYHLVLNSRYTYSYYVWYTHRERDTVHTYTHVPTSLGHMQHMYVRITAHTISSNYSHICIFIKIELCTCMLQLFVPKYYTYYVLYMYVRVDLCLENTPSVYSNSGCKSGRHITSPLCLPTRACDVWCLVQWWNTYICMWEMFTVWYVCIHNMWMYVGVSTVCVWYLHTYVLTYIRKYMCTYCIRVWTYAYLWTCTYCVS